MRVTRLRRVVLDRLIRYYRYLADLLARNPVTTITSAQLGKALDVDPSQVRKDLGALGVEGMSHVGYDVCEICRAIRTSVGFDDPFASVLIGVGKLGGAVLASSDFQHYGLRIVGVFDRDPFKVGRHYEGHAIQPIDEMPEFVKTGGIRLAILATPADAAQPLTDILVLCGVQAIWNFTPARLSVPAGILARNERLSVGLAEIAYHLKKSRLAEPAEDPAACPVRTGAQAVAERPGKRAGTTLTSSRPRPTLKS